MKQASSELIRACRSGDAAQKIAAIMALKALGAVEAIEVVLDCLDDAEPGVRVVAATAAGVLGELAGAPAFIGRRLLEVLTDSCSMVRSEAVESLGQLRLVESRECIERLLLTDECELVRAEAASCLGTFGHRAAVPLLEGALADPAPLVRMDAAAALARLGSVGSVPALRKAASAGVTGWELRELWVALYELGEYSALGELLVAAGRMPELEAQSAVVRIAQVIRPEHTAELLAGLEAIAEPGPGLQVDIDPIRRRLAVSQEDTWTP